MCLMFAVAAVLGYGPTHLLSLSKLPWAVAPPVLSKMTLIYISVNLALFCFEHLTGS